MRGEQGKETEKKEEKFREKRRKRYRERYSIRGTERGELWRGLKRGGGKNACRKNGEASDAAVAARGPYRPPPTPETRIHTYTSSLSLPFSSVFATASTPMTSKRWHTRTCPPVPLSLVPSVSRLRPLAGSLRPGVCTASPKRPRIFDLGGSGV